ncbi:MAG: hypothetical protein PHI23_01040 [Candidatus Peribacteraceae bacterium]|nr:hypothetical protein [Candidatus Peribacteraceae bacterium]
MASNFLRKIIGLELEEKILNVGALIGLVGVFLPWIGGERLGGLNTSYSGFGFYTSFIGIVVFLLLLALLLITIVPLTGGPILLRKRHREVARLCLAGAAVILILAALSVLTKVTFEFSRMEVRFGIYVSLIGSLITLLYAFLRFQEQRRNQVQEIFHHPDEEVTPPKKEKEAAESFEAPPPPPPPPPLEPEEHRLYP